MSFTPSDRAPRPPFRAGSRSLCAWIGGITAVAVLAACGDSDGPTPPQPGAPSGALQFGFSGAESGSFQAEGQIGFDPGGPAFGTWAYGVYSQVDQTLGIAAFQGHSPPHGDTFILALEGATGTGSVSINGTECLEGDPTHCRIGWVAFGVTADAAGSATQDSYFMLEGTVDVTNRSGDRVGGTFSGTAVHMTDYALEVPDPRTIEIANGSFDVPLFQD